MTITTQTALFDADEGIRKSAHTAGVEWLISAKSELKELLLNNPSFFCDDIWNKTPLEKGKQPKALGYVIKQAVEDGWIEEIRHENGIVALPSNSSNRQLKRVWKSKLYKGEKEIPIIETPERETQLQLYFNNVTNHADSREIKLLTNNKYSKFGFYCLIVFAVILFLYHYF